MTLKELAKEEANLQFHQSERERLHRGLRLLDVSDRGVWTRNGDQARPNPVLGPEHSSSDSAAWLAT